MGTTIFGINILTEDEQTAGQSGPFRVSFTIDNIKEVKEAEKFQEKFDKFYKQLYLDLVIEIHKYLIRLTPLHTGKLRGGWTAFLDKHQADYSKQIKDTSLYQIYKSLNITPEYRQYAFSPEAVEKGKSESHLEDKLPVDTDVSIDNQVEYKDYLDYGTTKISPRHFTDLAKYKGELVFEIYFNRWLKTLQEKGAIVPPPKVEEIGN